MILYRENPKDTTKKLLELINNSLKFQDAKSIYKIPLHFYTLIMAYPKEK